MSLILSGTDGLSDVDGSAATPAIRGTDANTGIFFPAADTIAFAEGGAEVARFDSAGNFGLGVTPSAWGTSFKVLQFANAASIGSSNDPTLQITQNGFYNGTNWIYSTTAPVSNYYQSAGTHVWRNAPSGTAGNAITFTQAMTLDASGNLGVGTTSPASKLNVADTSTNCTVTVTNSASNFQVQSNANDGYFNLNGSGNIIFRSGTPSVTERARIDSSGNLLVGTTTNSLGGKVTSNGVATIGGGCFAATGFGDAIGYGMRYQQSTTNGVPVQFLNSGGTQIGTISTTGSATSYVTSSDYRLKEDIQPMVGALSVIEQLNPVTYKWKADGSDGQGFIAHELQAVIPDAVSGEKDAVNEDGSINPQGIDTSFLVATLTAAIQEQQALITQLTARITALESA